MNAALPDKSGFKDYPESRKYDLPYANASEIDLALVLSTKIHSHTVFKRFETPRNALYSPLPQEPHLPLPAPSYRERYI